MSQTPAQARRQRERDERKGAILAAARAVFFERGTWRATVDDIAARAEVSKGTVYLYFESRETILAHLLLEGLGLLLERLECAYQPARRLPAARRLRRLARAYQAFAEEFPDYFRLLMAFDRGHFDRSLPAELYQQILADSLRGFDFVVQAVQQGVDDGDFLTRRPRRTAAALWAAINGVVVLLSHPLRRMMIGAESGGLYHAMLETLLHGIARAEPRQ